MTHEFQERREGYARVTPEEMHAINTHIAEENGVIKSLKMVTGLLSLLIAVLIWVYLDGRADQKAQSVMTNQLAIQGSQTLSVLQSHMEVTRREFDRINRVIEK